ncbi:hypothetical protein [Acetivibrio saccincola]
MYCVYTSVAIYIPKDNSTHLNRLNSVFKLSIYISCYFFVFAKFRHCQYS